MAVVLRAYRSGYHTVENMVKVIHDVWELPDRIERNAIGCLTENPEMVFDSFALVQQNALCKTNIRYHLIQLEMDFLVTEEQARAVMEVVVEYFSRAFQVFYVLQKKHVYVLSVLVNSVSYQDLSKCFHDNNNMYTTLLEYLNAIFGMRIRFVAGPNLLFDRRNLTSELYERMR